MPQRYKGGRKEAQKRYREEHRELVNKRNRDWYWRNRDREIKKRRQYLNENREKIYKYNADWQKRFWIEIRKEMIESYGSKCVCCGESEPVFLDLDHINNDGNIMRKVAGNSRQEMLNLREVGWPKKNHQLLCSNCNQGKRRNGGICPHKLKKDQ